MRFFFMTPGQWGDIFAAWLLKVWLWFKRARGIACRACGLQIAPELARAFVAQGCPSCGAQTLKLL